MLFKSCSDTVFDMTATFIIPQGYQAKKLPMGEVKVGDLIEYLPVTNITPKDTGALLIENEESTFWGYPTDTILVFQKLAI